MSDIRKIADKMELKCNDGCDHKFCLKSFVDMKFEKEMKKRGTNGKFYKCKESQSKRDFALKVIDIPDQIKYIEENINNYQHLSHHERIIKYCGNFEYKEKLYIFMEYINGGSLLDKIQNRYPIPHKNVIKYTKQILEGLSFLQENKIVHRDIKPSNILMLESDDIKLCDFGLSRYVSDSISSEKPNQELCTQCGTYNYMAPEIINNEAYSYPIDIWSAGATFVAMVTGKNPYPDLSGVKVAETISKLKKIDFVPTEQLTSEMDKLVHDMLNSDPSTRPTAKELLNYKILL